jgi:eukaryotic-like serine/threonine-protein kinase
VAVSRVPADGTTGEIDLFAPDDSAFKPEDYAVGSVLAGKFRIERVIGVGSMGVVLAATHLGIDEKVAIKFIRAEVQKLPGILTRFAREAKAAVRLKSEHIAQVLDVGVSDSIGPYIVMEYLDGQNLAEILETQGPLEIRRAVHYVMQACEALAVAHANGITHRDIKPENLFVTRQGDRELVKLLDFGISKAALTGKVFGDELSDGDSSCLLGTPLYMSPEQIRSTAEVHHPTDIWSLGAVLYELITGRSAFVADSVAQVWNRILETNPGPLAHYCPHAPAELQAVIDRCLEKDPGRRFSNVADLAIALQPFAPSRARLHAQRASSILGRSSDSAYPAAPPSMASLRATAVARSSRPSGPLLMPSEPLAAPASSRKSWAVSAEKPSHGRWAVLALVGAALIAVGLFAMPAVQTPLAQPSAAAPLPPVEEAPARQAAVVRPKVAAAEAAPEPSSQPSPRPAIVEEPPAGPAVVHEIVSEPPGPARGTKARSAARAARKGSRPRGTEDNGATAAASAPGTKPAEAPRAAEPAAPAPARLVDDGPRVRLIQDESRAQLLD